MAEGLVDVFLAVGSNIDPERHIRDALTHVKSLARVTGVSMFYRTHPLGPPGQPPFLNGVWRIETSTPAHKLKFDCLRSVEMELGRVRTADKYAPRTIDLDLILYGQAVIDEPGLKVPDPDICTRAFIAIPVLELAPDLVLPDVEERLASVTRVGVAGMEPVKEFTERLRRTAFEA